MQFLNGNGLLLLVETHKDKSWWHDTSEATESKVGVHQVREGWRVQPTLKFPNPWQKTGTWREPSLQEQQNQKTRTQQRAQQTLLNGFQLINWLHDRTEGDSKECCWPLRIINIRIANPSKENNEEHFNITFKSSGWGGRWALSKQRPSSLLLWLPVYPPPPRQPLPLDPETSRQPRETSGPPTSAQGQWLPWSSPVATLFARQQ